MINLNDIDSKFRFSNTIGSFYSINQKMRYGNYYPLTKSVLFQTNDECILHKFLIYVKQHDGYSGCTYYEVDT